MKTFASPGVCDPSGDCVYESQEILCSYGCTGNMCNGDPCEDVECTDIPGQCFGEGACSDGSCSYPYLDDGTVCEDENPCTYDDVCESGVCAGFPVVCNDPPNNECLDAVTLKDFLAGGTCVEESGDCVYEWEEVACDDGCVDGVCIVSIGLLQSELTPAGLLGLTSLNYGMSCVMPGWYEGSTMSSTTYYMDAGFLP